MRCTNVSQLQAGVAKCVGESGLRLSWGHSSLGKCNAVRVRGRTGCGVAAEATTGCPQPRGPVGFLSKEPVSPPPISMTSSIMWCYTFLQVSDMERQS